MADDDVQTCKQVLYSGYCDNEVEPGEELCPGHLYEPSRDDIWWKADEMYDDLTRGY